MAHVHGIHVQESDRFDYRQCCDSCAGIFKWNFDHFMLETVTNALISWGKNTKILHVYRVREPHGNPDFNTFHTVSICLKVPHF